MAKPARHNEFWTRLTAELERRDWSQAELARRLGVDKGTVNRWKDASPGLASMRKVADVLGMRVDELDGTAQAKGAPALAASPVVAQVAEAHGLNPEAALRAAFDALALFLRARGHSPETSGGAPVYTTGLGVSGMVAREGLIESEVWRQLTDEQRMGLALLVHGRDVPDWRVRAALELLMGEAEDKPRLVRSR